MLVQVSEQHCYKNLSCHPVRTALWAPSSEAFAIVLGGCHPETLLVYTAALELVRQRPGDISCLAWAPCSTKLLHSAHKQLEVTGLPYDPSSKRVMRQHLAALRAKLAAQPGHTVTDISWSPHGTCCVCTLDFVLLLCPTGAAEGPFTVQQIDKVLTRLPCLSPSGERLLYCGKTSLTSLEGIRLADMRADQPALERCLWRIPGHVDVKALAWHPGALLT